MTHTGVTGFTRTTDYPLNREIPMTPNMDMMIIPDHSDRGSGNAAMVQV